MRTAAVSLVFLAALFGPALVSAQTAEEVLDRFDAEPTILEVQNAAAEYAQISQGAMSGWNTRASLSALLPRLRVEYRLTNDDNLQNDYDEDFRLAADGTLIADTVQRDQSGDDDEEIRLRFQGDWELPELIFNPDILRISNEVSDLVELREDILTAVTTLYFERRRAQVQMLLDPPSDAIERLRRELEIQELTAGIDALTGGWFSSELSQAGLPTY